MEKYAIIVAGGKGSRFKSEIPKQFHELAGKPVLMHSIEAFYNYQHDIKIYVVLPADQIDHWLKLCEKFRFKVAHSIIEGGNVRFYSVKNALDLINLDALVAIHDGVRPLIDYETIDRCFKTASSSGNAIPVVNLVDSVRLVFPNGKNRHVDRSIYRLIQTPQVFQTTLIKKAFEQNFSELFTDDASVLESIMPGTIKLVEGNRRNIKITTHEDLLYAEAIFKNLTK